MHFLQKWTYNSCFLFENASLKKKKNVRETGFLGQKKIPQSFWEIIPYQQPKNKENWKKIINNYIA